MKNSEILKVVNLLSSALDKMPEEEKQEAENLKKLYNSFFNIEKSSIQFGAGGYIQNAICLLSDTLIADEKANQAKSNGNSVRLKAALSWQKRHMKDETPNRHELTKYPDYQGEYQVFADNYMMVALKEHLGFIEKTDNLVGKYPLSIDICMPKSHDDILEMPDISELKVWYKNEKAKRKQNKQKEPISYHFGGELPLINAEKLITAIEVMPKDTKWYSFGMKTSYGKNGEKYVASNLYGENNAGDKCIIMGMRFMKNETEKTDLTA